MPVRHLNGEASALNHLLDRSELQNQYFVLRHGHSQANEAGIIVSHPKNGLDQYGLTAAGRDQVTRTLKASPVFRYPLRIVSSDFKRTRETAELAHALLESPFDVKYDQRLRERNFGELELGPDNRYPDIWRHDRTDPDSTCMGTESANQVMERVTALVNQCEHSEMGTTFLLVSHGDALQILQTAFNGQPASRHREQVHLETAELREMRLRLQVTWL